jgi:hypothetical protein
MVADRCRNGTITFKEAFRAMTRPVTLALARGRRSVRHDKRAATRAHKGRPYEDGGNE